MKNLILIICLVFSFIISRKANAQNGSKLTVDSVVLTTNSADVDNLIPIGPVDALTQPVFMGGKKKLTAIAELSLKQQAVTQGANIVYVKTNDFFYYRTNNGGGNKVHMAGVLYYGHIGGPKNNAESSAGVNGGVAIADVNNPGDLSGKWDGIQTNGMLIMHYELNLSKIGENLYSGYDYCLWVKNANNTTLKYEGSEPPNAKKAFLGFFKDGFMNVTEVSDIEGGNWGPSAEKFRLIMDGGAPVFVNGDGNTGSRKFSLKRTGEYPANYLKYVINKGSLNIDTVNYHNPNLATSIKYNEKGYFEFSLNNKTAIDLKGLKVSLDVDENGAGIDNTDAGNLSFDIDANSKKTLDVGITTNLALPVTALKIKLTISANGAPLAIKYFSIPTSTFFKTANVNVTSYTTSRMRAVAGYYGLLGSPYKNVPLMLDPLVASGDKIAGMWKAVFLSMGYGEYKIDEAQSYSIGKSCLKTVEDKARNGDAEAIFLMFYACQMGLEGEAGKAFAMSFLEKTANAGFKPALYDYGLQFIWHKDYSSALTYLNKSYDSGTPKAAEVIGRIYEKGLSVTPDLDVAISWYKKGMAFGDPEAMLCYANLVAKGIDNTPPDITKAMGIATSAAAKNCTSAMIFNGTLYAEGKKGIGKNHLLAIRWFKAAAEQGDRQGMYALGETYTTEKHGMVKDENSGFFWIKKAAELGSPVAMIVLASDYNSGTGTEKSIIAGRYWYNQAVLNGYAQADATGVNAAENTFLNFWKYADFSPSYIYVNEYGEKVADGDDGFESGLISGLFGSMASYYGNQQQLIDGLQYICKKNGYKIYGGTVSSSFVSNLYLKQGQSINIRSYGIISTGMMSGLANADGLGSAWAEYRVVQDIPCSAVMAGIKDGKWQFIGQKNTYTAPKDGPLVIGLNGIDYRNYKGYFDLVIEVPEN